MARVQDQPREAPERQGSGEPAEEEVSTVGHGPLTPADGWDALVLPDDSGLTVYRMSGLGGDLSSLVAGALGVEGSAPPWMQGYLDEGTAAEAEIIELFCEEFQKRRATYPELAQLAEDGVIAGYNAQLNQVQVWLRVGTTGLVRGHTDGVVVINPQGKNGFSFAVVEVKKFRPTLWNTWKATGDFNTDPVLEKYGWQVAALHHATGLPVYFVVGEFDPKKGTLTGVIDTLLVNAENVPHSKGEITARVMKAKKHVDAGVVPVCELHDDSCFYAGEDFCPGKVKKDVEAAEDLDDVELGRLLGLYYAYTVDMQATQEQKDAEKLRKAVKDQIDKHVADKGYARSSSDDTKLYSVWDEAGNEYRYEWVRYEIAGRAATTGNRVNVELVINAESVAPEDHPE